MEFVYNTDREGLILKEYGRNVQMLVDYISSLEDKEEKEQKAELLIDLLKQLNPVVKDSSENIQRIWDHLFIMSDNKLDIESPYPRKDQDADKGPQRVPYNKHKLMFRHYGRNIELMVQKVLEMESVEERKEGLKQIGRLMKSFYTTWNRDKVEDEVIIEHIKQLSKGRITLDIEYVRQQKLFDGYQEVREKPRTKDRERNSGRSRRHSNSRSNNYSKNNRKKYR